MRVRVDAVVPALMTVVTVTLLLTSCSTTGPGQRTASSAGVPAVSSAGEQAGVPADTAEVALVQRALDRFNATAGGPVTTQQSVLGGLVSAEQATEQGGCPPATVTISMDPVYARLTASPGWHPKHGNLPGTVYAVPTLLRIYTGDRITGTDLTDLHLAIDDGQVRFPAVCLR